MEKLLMLGTSHASVEIIKYAKSQGVYTIVTDYFEPEFSEAKRYSDAYWMVNTGDLDELERKCREENVTAVVCGVSEFNLEKTMELTKRLGLNCYCTPEAWHYSRNKRDFKELCMSLGVPMATDYKISDDLADEELEQIHYPVVVKPVDLSGNRGISFCYNKEDVREAFALVRSVSKNTNIIVERMLHGQEIGACYAMAEGEIRLVGIISMNSEPGQPTNCYSISTTVSPYIEKFRTEINDKIIEALKAVGCREGYAWVETILDEDDHFYLLEMGYRLSGDMTFLSWRDVADYDAIGWIVDYARGKGRGVAALPEGQKKQYDKSGCVYVIWTDHDGTIAEIQGLDQIREQFPDCVIEFLRGPGDEAYQYGAIGQFCFAEKDCRTMCETLQKINSVFHVYDTNGKELAIKYTDFEHLMSLAQ